MTKTHLRGIPWDPHSPWDFPGSLRGPTLTWYLSPPLKKNNTRLLSFREPVTMETWTALLLLKSLLERKDGSSHTWWDNLVITLRSDGCYMEKVAGLSLQMSEGSLPARLRGGKCFAKQQLWRRTQTEVLINIFVNMGGHQLEVGTKKAYCPDLWLLPHFIQLPSGFLTCE